jgi:MarR family transcriptional regulator, 2-MHQ and catechol-resistance regulon repressor
MARPAEDSSGVHVWLILMKAHAALLVHAHESIRELKLCDSDFFVLEALLHKGPLPVNTIGQKVRLTSGSISIAVDRLVRRKLAERCGSLGDKRVRMVQLTEDGRRLIEAAFAKHSTSMQAAASGLSEAERGQLVRLLKKLGKTAAAAAPIPGGGRLR